MHISREETDFLADPRCDSGYRFVFPYGDKFSVAFSHGYERVRKSNFYSSTEAAKYVVAHFRKLYGESWPEHIVEQPKCRGPGWEIVRIGDKFALDVCPRGFWHRTMLKTGKRSRSLFPTVKSAKQALGRLNRELWPAFRGRYLVAKAKEEPKWVILLPAKTVHNRNGSVD